MNLTPEQGGEAAARFSLDAIGLRVSQLDYANDELLGVATEQALARYIQAGVAARGSLADLSDTPEDQAERAQREEIISKAQTAGTLLLEANWRWACSYAERFQGKAGNMHDDDLGQVAFLRVHELIEAYAPTPNNPTSFRAYAQRPLRLTLRGYASTRGLDFVPLETEEGFHSDMNRLVEAVDPEEVVTNRREEYHPVLHKLFMPLTEAQRDVLLRRLVPEEPETLEQIAESQRPRITRERVRQIEAAARGKAIMTMVRLATEEGMLNPLHTPADNELDAYPIRQAEQREIAAERAMLESEQTLGEVLKRVTPQHRKNILLYLQEGAEKWGEELPAKLAEVPPRDPKASITALVHPSAIAARRTITEIKRDFLDNTPDPHDRLDLLRACYGYISGERLDELRPVQKAIILLHRLKGARDLPKTEER